MQEARSVAGSCCSTSCQSSSTQGSHRTERLPVKLPESEAALLPPLSIEASWAPSQQSLQLEGCDHFHPHCFCSTFQEVQGRRKWWMWGHRFPEPLWELAYLIPNPKGTRCIKNLMWITRLFVTLHTCLLIFISKWSNRTCLTG